MSCHVLNLINDHYLKSMKKGMFNLPLCVRTTFHNTPNSLILIVLFLDVHYKNFNLLKTYFFLEIP